MFYSMLLAAAQATVPHTPAWSPSVGLVMILANLFAIAIGYKAIQNPGKGPGLSSSGLFAKFGVAELLATASFGHLLGTGIILGLANAGVL